MTKSAYIRARIEPLVKKQAENVFVELGITPTQAITMLYKYVAREHKWPINLKVPNSATLKVFKDTDSKVNLISSKDTNDMFSKLGI